MALFTVSLLCNIEYKDDSILVLLLVILGLASDVINKLIFITDDMEVHGPFGENHVEGRPFVSFRPECTLVYFSGHAGNHLDGLTLHYDCCE